MSGDKIPFIAIQIGNNTDSFVGDNLALVDVNNAGITIGSTDQIVITAVSIAGAGGMNLRLAEQTTNRKLFEASGASLNLSNINVPLKAGKNIVGQAGASAQGILVSVTVIGFVRRKS